MFCSSKKAYFFWEIPKDFRFFRHSIWETGFVTVITRKGGIFPTHLVPITELVQRSSALRTSDCLVVTKPARK